MSNISPRHQRTASEPHSYNIQAKLQGGVLSIFVHDTVLDLAWNQEFTHDSFPGHRLFDVGTVLILAIQKMIASTDDNDYYSDIPKSKSTIAILVYNQWCYLTVYNSNLPSFALRPCLPIDNIKKGKSSSQKQKKTDKHSLPNLQCFNSNGSSGWTVDHDIASPSSSEFEDVEEYATTHESNDSLFTNDGMFSVRRNASTDSIYTVETEETEEDDEPFESDLFETKMYPSSSASRFRANKMWTNDTKANQSNNKKKKSKKKELTITLNGEVIENMTEHAFEQQIAEDEFYDEEDSDETYYNDNYLGIAPYEDY